MGHHSDRDQGGEQAAATGRTHRRGKRWAGQSTRRAAAPPFLALLLEEGAVEGASGLTERLLPSLTGAQRYLATRAVSPR